MNILIAGGAGFIGSNSAHYFRDAGHNIIILDNLLSGFEENISDIIDDKGVKFYKGDIRDKGPLTKIFSENKIDLCINFAALVSVAESTENPALTEEINTKGMINLLQFCGKNRIKTFVHASSAAVYGDSQELPKRENMLPEPKSPYAISKLAGEYYNNFFASIYGFNAVNCRFFNVFGPKQNPESQYAAAVPIFIKKALLNKNLTIFGDGKQVRDFIYVYDLISAIEYLINNADKIGNKNTFNIGYGNYISINELSRLIIKLSGSQSEIEYSEHRAGDIKLSYASVKKLKDFGWKEKTGFNEGLARAIEWYKENID